MMQRPYLSFSSILAARPYSLSLSFSSILAAWPYSLSFSSSSVMAARPFVLLHCYLADSNYSFIFTSLLFKIQSKLNIFNPLSCYYGSQAINYTFFLFSIYVELYNLSSMISVVLAVRPSFKNRDNKRYIVMLKFMISVTLAVRPFLFKPELRKGTPSCQHS